MAFFGLFGNNKKQENSTPIINTTQQEFSAPFMKIGTGNLASPLVSTYYQTNGYVRFGEDNLYPQILTQLYHQSPLHGAIIDFITDSVIGGSYKWKDDSKSTKQKVELLAFEKRVNLKKLVTAITKDYVMHRRITIKVCKSTSGIVSIKRIDPSYIRNSADLCNYTYSSDWTKGNVGIKVYKEYRDDLEESLYVYQELSPGQDIYPIPTYNSCLNACFLDSEIMFFHKSNIQNSIFPSLVIRRPKEFASTDEISKFKTEIASKTGAANAGRVLVLTGNGFDDTPEATTIAVSGNDRLFAETTANIEDQICKAHKINPLLMGIKVAGSLGNSQELEFGYTIYEKVIVMPIRNVMNEVINELIDICNIQGTIEINNFQIINKEIQKTN